MSKENGANAIVSKYVKWSFGAGLIPLPGLDLAALAGVQLKLVAALAKHYDIKFIEHQGKAAISALLGVVVPNSLATPLGSALKAVPVVGQTLGMVAMPSLAAASTYALGRVFIQHFASGGTFLDFNPEEVRAHYAKDFEDAKKGGAAKAA